MSNALDKLTVQNFFVDGNNQLAKTNDEEILANLDAAVTANGKKIQTNNNHIKALETVSNAYVEQSNAQTEATNAEKKAAQSQINADNAQTVSNMISALPENPTQQQIAMVKQAIQENPGVYGDQGATIISNLEANPPNIKAAGSNASAIASTANDIAQTDQKAASAATTNATNAAKNVDNAKKAAVESGVSESDVSSAAAASSASTKLRQENANLTEVNNNAQNAREYITQRQREREQQQTAKDNAIRDKKNGAYNIGRMTPTISTSELVDLRNINYKNFRGGKGTSSMASGQTQFQNGASRSFYMHVDYVFSNDLNMSSIDEKYKQIIQPIILNEFQPNEMIKLDDIINGTLKFMGPLLQSAIGIVGDFAKPATKMVTNKLIEELSKTPKTLYKERRSPSQTTEERGKDYLFDPVTKVRNMFRGGKWLNTYELPFFNNSFLEAQWSKNWSANGITGEFGENVGKVIQDKFGIDYPTQPKFTVNMGQAGRSEFDIEFYLINKDTNALMKNFQFLTAFYAGTSWMNLYGGFVRPPNVYNVICPGRFEIPWAAIDSVITYEGKLRKKVAGLEPMLSGVASMQGEEIYWPDAWKMKIHVKDLSVNNFNMYADFYQYGFNPSSYVINETSVLNDMFDAASWGAGEVAIMVENGKRLISNSPKLSDAEKVKIRKENAEKVAAAKKKVLNLEKSLDKNNNIMTNPFSSTTDVTSALMSPEGKTRLENGVYVVNHTDQSGKTQQRLTGEITGENIGTIRESAIKAELAAQKEAIKKNEETRQRLLGRIGQMSESEIQQLDALNQAITNGKTRINQLNNMGRHETVMYMYQNNMIAPGSNFKIIEYAGNKNGGALPGDTVNGVRSYDYGNSGVLNESVTYFGAAGISHSWERTETVNGEKYTVSGNANKVESRSYLRNGEINPESEKVTFKEYEISKVKYEESSRGQRNQMAQDDVMRGINGQPTIFHADVNSAAAAYELTK